MPINTVAYLCVCTCIQNHLPAEVQEAHPADHSALQRHSHIDWSAGPTWYLCTSFFTQCQFLCQQMNVCCQGQPVSPTEATVTANSLPPVPLLTLQSSPSLTGGQLAAAVRRPRLPPRPPSSFPSPGRSLAPGLSGRPCAGAEPLHPARSAASDRRDASPALGRRRSVLWALRTAACPTSLNSLWHCFRGRVFSSSPPSIQV